MRSSAESAARDDDFTELLLVARSLLNTFMRPIKFTDFLSDLETPADGYGVDESAVIVEALSPGVAKTAAIGIVMKMAQLRRRIEDDRTADGATQSLASMVFLLGSMLAVTFGTIDKKT
jgi:hypothetical protein